MRALRRRLVALLALVIVAAACGDTDDPAGDAATESASDPPPSSTTDASATDTTVPSRTVPSPTVLSPTTPSTSAPPTSALPPTTLPALDDVGQVALEVVQSLGPLLDLPAVRELGQTGDPRWAWLVADIMRFYAVDSPETSALTAAAADLTGFTIDEDLAWLDVTNQLIDADIDAPPEYELFKRMTFGAVDARWAPMLTDVTGLDLRHVSWGGVFPDDRSFGDAGRCVGRGCIPALDEPAVTDAAGGDWYDDGAVVFGIVVDGEARAYPKNIMEVHEMVNDTVAGRQLGIPYCTLCGSAQAYFTDEVPGVDGRLVLRTSGLLQRSNKVMVDLDTGSLWDTFQGTAGSGELGRAGVELEPVTVEVSTWGDWKATHPDTTIVAADGGIGRVYPDDPLGGRDADGPIFPIGEVDPRLAVQEQVVGVTAPDGTAVAFPAAEARAAIEAGSDVELGGVRLTTDGGGFRSVAAADGAELAAHQAFWFAWVQRNPDTLLWAPEGL